MTEARRRLLERVEGKGRSLLLEVTAAYSILCRTLVKRAADRVHQISVRYQSMTACAGAICESEGRRYSPALALIHEFVTGKTEHALFEGTTNLIIGKATR